jgi:hypothetical protein
MMSSTPTDKQFSKPELLRDVELLLDERFIAERKKRHRAEQLGRYALILAAVSLLATSLMGYTLYDRRGPGISAGKVRTREVSLIDNTGKVRGRWSMLPEGGTRLSFLDDAGVERMRLTLLNNGAQGITLADARGEGRVVLSLEGGEGSRLTFADAAGRPRTILGLSSQQAATLIFADEYATPRAAVGLEPDGRGTFMLPSGRSRPPGQEPIPDADATEPADSTNTTTGEQ